MSLPPSAMKTEAKKRYSSGFTLTEGELRRLHEVLVQQIKKTPIGDEFRTSYELKYRNGSVAYPTSLDDVLAQENFGSAGILRLTMQVFDQDEKPAQMIGISFANADDEESYYPIAYVVSGTDRDWAFVTSSQIDERIAKIKRFSPNQFFSRKRSSLITTPLMMLITVSLVCLVFLALFSVGHRHDLQAGHQLDVLEQSWKAGTLKDPAEVVIQIARINQYRADFSRSEMILPFAAIMGIPVFLLLLGLCYLYFQPSYIFLWGDCIEAYEKRRSLGRILFVGVILAFVVGLAVNFISKKIGM
jgi:hypothetical protein